MNKNAQNPPFMLAMLSTLLLGYTGALLAASYSPARSAEVQVAKPDGTPNHTASYEVSLVKPGGRSRLSRND